MDGNLGRFYNWAIMNSSPISTDIKESLWYNNLDSSRYISTTTIVHYMVAHFSSFANLFFVLISIETEFLSHQN